MALADADWVATMTATNNISGWILPIGPHLGKCAEQTAFINRDIFRRARLVRFGGGYSPSYAHLFYEEMF